MREIPTRRSYLGQPVTVTAVNTWPWLLVSVTLIVVFVLDHLELWYIVAVPQGVYREAVSASEHKSLFLDWHAVLAASDCKALGYNPFISNPCDLGGRVHNYGGIWLYLGQLGLTRTDFFWSALAFLVLPYVVSASFLLNPTRLSEFVLGLSLILSPASMLGIERANIDILIFAVLFAGAVLLVHQRLAIRISGLGLYFLAAVSKLYPITAALTAVVGAKSRRETLLIWSLVGFAFAAYLYSVRDQLLIVQKTIPQPAPAEGLVFGAKLLFLHLNTIRSVPLLHVTNIEVTTAIAAALTLLISLWLVRLIKWPAPLARLEAACIVTGGSVLALTFFVSSNYDYRCVFIIFTVPYLFRVARSGNLLQAWAARISLALSVYVMWAFGTHQAILSLLTSKPHIADWGQALSYLIEFTVTYALIALLMSAIIGLGWHYWRE